jgi:hypothetical protein
MFYRHYKGGIYYTLGVTTRVTGGYYVGDVAVGDVASIKARHTEEDRVISIYMSDSRFYVLYKNNANLILYIDSKGDYWLRPRDMFHGFLIVDGNEVERFRLLL